MRQRRGLINLSEVPRHVSLERPLENLKIVGSPLGSVAQTFLLAGAQSGPESIALACSCHGCSDGRDQDVLPESFPSSAGTCRQGLEACPK